MRYWTRPPATLAHTDDSVDLAAVEPSVGWVELADEAAYVEAATAITEAAPAPRTPITTNLVGNNESYVTDPEARSVTVWVNAPDVGALRARPTIDGVPVLASGAPYAYALPGRSITVATNAGSNDLLIVEEF